MVVCEHALLGLANDRLRILFSLSAVILLMPYACLVLAGDKSSSTLPGEARIW